MFYSLHVSRMSSPWFFNAETPKFLEEAIYPLIFICTHSKVYSAYSKAIHFSKLTSTYEAQEQFFKAFEPNLSQPIMCERNGEWYQRYLFINIINISIFKVF